MWRIWVGSKAGKCNELNEGKNFLFHSFYFREKNLLNFKSDVHLQKDG